MKNQPNDMVTLEWLLPLFNQQLSQVADGWQLDVGYADNERMAQHYHEIGGALTMINLPALASLANKLSLLAGANTVDDLNSDSNSGLVAEKLRVGQVAHRLLQRELSYYACTGSKHSALINKTVTELMQVLIKFGLVIETFSDSDLSADSLVGLADHEEIEITIPAAMAMSDLDNEQHQQLLLVWRQQSQKLLAANTNSPAILAPLEKVSHYLWQTAQETDLQRLWYLTELWLHDLGQNNNPLPKNYAGLLAQLDQVIDGRQHQLELSDNDLKQLISSIYIELSGFIHNSDNAQSLLDGGAQTEAETRFLPRILNEIETIVFTLDKPQVLLKPLAKISNQLEDRGWTLFGSQLRSIADDIKLSLSSERNFDQQQWQFERQLQELYSAIYNTEQVIATKIGSAASFTILDDSNNDLPLQSHLYSGADEVDLRELRIAAEEVKQDFHNYIQRQQLDLLPNQADFASMSHAFNSMGLPLVGDATDKIADVFTQINTHKIEVLSWDITQALAEGLTSIELLLDYLAQQFFDQSLLDKANTYINTATNLLDTYIHAPEKVNDTFLSQKPVANDVLRYDDSGEIAPIIVLPSNIEALIDAVSNDGNVIVREGSDALIKVRQQLQPDNFDIDEDIREIFIEEVGEVVTDLKDFLPIWQQDAQDLTPLTELRRGFHTLKGSGRMVGAFSISEMAWSIENLLNRLLDKTLPVTDDVVTLVTETIKRLPAMLIDFIAQQPPSFDPAITLLQSQNLMTQQPLNAGLAVEDTSLNASIEQIVSISEHDILEHDLRSQAISSVAEPTATLGSLANLQLPLVLQPFILEAEVLAADASDADPDIKEIFLEEANEVLEEIVPLYEHWQLSPTDLNGLTDIRRGFHTLKGSGRMVGAHYSAELAWSIENMLNRILDKSIAVSADIQQLIDDVLKVYPELLITFERESQDYPVMLPLWVACANAYSK